VFPKHYNFDWELISLSLHCVQIVNMLPPLLFAVFSTLAAAATLPFDKAESAFDSPTRRFISPRDLFQRQSYQCSSGTYCDSSDNCCGLDCCETGYSCSSLLECELGSGNVSCPFTTFPVQDGSFANCRCSRVQQLNNRVDLTAVILVLGISVVQILNATLFVLANSRLRDDIH